MSRSAEAGNLDISNQHGEIEISDQTGNAALTVESSAVRIQHVKGDVTIQGHAKEVDVEDVDGAVRLSGEYYESVRLVRVAKTVDSIRRVPTCSLRTSMAGWISIPAICAPIH